MDFNLKQVDMFFGGGAGGVLPLAKNGRTALILAAEKGRADCARLLVDAGADKEARDVGGCTALIQAALRGHTVCARLLLDAGADKNAKDSVRYRFGLSLLRK